MRLLQSVDSQIDAEIKETEAARQAALTEFVAMSSKLAELQAARDLRAAMGGETKAVVPLRKEGTNDR